MIIFDKHFIIYLILVVVTTLVLSVILIKIFLNKRMRHLIAVLKNRIAIMRMKKEYIQSDLGEIENPSADIKEIKQEFELLLMDLQNRNESELKSALFDFSVQVAHDIGSPLAALEILIQSSSISLPEDGRILIKDIASRIRNVLNSLLVKFRDREKFVAKGASPLDHLPVRSCVISANSGDAFWQPGVKGNCITIKASPWNIESIQHTVFLHELPEGDEVPEHSHEKNEEIFICLEGEGIIIFDGEEYPFKKHDVAFVAPLAKHCIRATSDVPLKFMVVISPAGLEDKLKLIGIPRKSIDEQPPEAFDSVIGNRRTHGVI